MAVYANSLKLTKSSTPGYTIYTTDYTLDVKVSHAGIYRCKEYPVEIGIAKGQNCRPSIITRTRTDHHTYKKGDPIC